MASTTLSSHELATLGLQEMMRCYWMDLEGLGLLSMLTVRMRQSASDGRFWRAAVRAMFPRHPFEVSILTLNVLGLSFCSSTVSQCEMFYKASLFNCQVL